MRNPPWTRDELIVGMDAYFDLFPSEIGPSHARIIELSRQLNELPFHREASRTPTFRNPTGIAMELRTFLKYDSRYAGRGLSKGSRLGGEIWREFSDNRALLRDTARAILAAGQQLSALPPRIASDASFFEGGLLIRLHLVRERSRAAVRAKRDSVLASGGRLVCEVCAFDFAAAYGELGIGLAECHHITPLHKLTRQSRTRLIDLAIVCSNCHRVLHHNEGTLTLEGLRAVVESRRP